MTSVLQGGPVSTVAPSTTSTALTSIVSGMPPGEHGVVGYRMSIEGHVLNVLRWSTVGDARRSMPPGEFQLYEPFGGQRDRKSTRLHSSQSCATRMPSPDCKKK